MTALLITVDQNDCALIELLIATGAKPRRSMNDNGNVKALMCAATTNLLEEDSLEVFFSLFF